MKQILDWKMIISGIGFLMIGASIIFPEQTLLLILGALLFAFGMFRRKPKKRR